MILTFKEWTWYKSYMQISQPNTQKIHLEYDSRNCTIVIYKLKKNIDDGPIAFLSKKW